MGENHGQEDRILTSKSNRSENLAKLYLAHKDHKKAKDKDVDQGLAEKREYWS